MRPHTASAIVISLAGPQLVPSTAFGQLTTTSTTTATATGPSITYASQTAPDRILNYGLPSQTNAPTRPVGLNPTGINYFDCTSDMTLGFFVTLSGFGTDGMQIWASVSGTCTDDSNRGNGGVPTCWLVNNGLPFGQLPSTPTPEYFIRVQDIVGWQQAPPDPPVLQHAGPSACSAQPSDAPVTITLWFVPLSTEGTYDTNGTAYKWPLTTDLVGPPAPVGLSVGAGQTLLVASWTANADSDTYGYDVFIDPPPGSLAQQMATTQTICSTSASSSSSSSTSSTSSGSSSSSSSSASDASCVTVNVAPPTPSIGVCSSAALGSAVVVDSGIVPVESDAAGEDAAALQAEEIDSGLVTEVGGIATVQCQYAVDVGCPSGSPIYTATENPTVSGETVTTFNITGLTDGLTYAVAVSAVDNSGNPGPPSAVMCNYPASVCDFYCAYSDAGGLAGGGFCALQGGTKFEASSHSPIGTWLPIGTAGIAAVAMGRRRRTRK